MLDLATSKVTAASTLSLARDKAPPTKGIIHYTKFKIIKIVYS